MDPLVSLAICWAIALILIRIANLVLAKADPKDINARARFWRLLILAVLILLVSLGFFLAGFYYVGIWFRNEVVNPYGLTFGLTSVGAGLLLALISLFVVSKVWPRKI